MQADQVLAAVGQLPTGQGLEQAFLQTIDLDGRFAIKPQPVQELFKDLRTVARQDLHQVSGLPLRRLLWLEAKQIHR
ncbi:hypothetical protein D3C78_1742470 [compost metagenome]